MLQAKDLRSDRVISDAIHAQPGDDAGNAFSPECIGRRTMDDFQIIGDRADQSGARMEWERNQLSHVRDDRP